MTNHHPCAGKTCVLKGSDVLINAMREVNDFLVIGSDGLLRTELEALGA